MSLILGYANKDNAIIMSDGRAVGEKYISENINKTMKINDSIIIGFAGIKEKIETFITHIFNEMGSDRKDYFIDDFLEMIEFYMKDKETQNQLVSSFIMIGRDKNNHMITSIAGHVTNYEVLKNIVETPRILTIGGNVDKELINEIFFKNVRDSKLSPIKRLNNTIIEVSKIDDSINGNIFYVSL